MTDENQHSPAPDEQTTPVVPPAKKPGIIKNSIIFSGLTLISRFMGLARDVVINAQLGASTGPWADAYNTALSFPNLFRRIFAEGAFSSAFVPAYSRTLAGEGPERADDMASDALATLAAMTLLLVILAQLAMPWLMYLINFGYRDDPLKWKITIILTQITMPYLSCMAIAALFSGALNARNRFILSGAAPIVLNAVMLIAVLPAKSSEQAAYAASIGVVIAGVLQAALLWWGCWNSGGRIRPRLPRLTPEIKRLIKQAIPAAIAASVTQINIFVSGSLVSLAPGDGPRTWLANADRLYQLPLGMVGVAIGIALLPRLSQALQAGDRQDAQDTTDQAVVFALAMTLPAAAALLAMPYFMIDALFTRGAFTTFDARMTAQALFHYGWGVPAFVLARVMNPIFFAREDTRSPMRFALISVGVNIVLGAILFFTIGFAGIAIATSAASWINVGQMYWALKSRGEWELAPASVSRLLRVLAAAAVLTALLGVAAFFRPQIQGVFESIALIRLGAKELAVLAVCIAIIPIYPVLVVLTGGMTVAEIKGLLRRRRAA
ncbi:MAG: murein biosynthesis integral membrane protein MurJ [Caulobacter sp.]|nr:murein biosynthesis integral membrane protein MurJ [Caulobacter sp.]